MADIGGEGITANVADFAGLLKDLALIDPELKKELVKELRAASEDAVAEAKQLASWSTGASGHGAVPDAIGTVVSRQGAGMIVRGAKAQHGPLYELGSKGGGGVVRHPLFGNTGFWYENATRPFLIPAAQKHAEEVQAKSEEALDRALKKAKFF